MDKNKIHIDDLVRNRLSGAEEQEPAGAWSSMRELLDKEMPVETAAFNWRRMLGYATALLMVCSATVGGYNYYRHTIAEQRQHNIIANTITGSSAGDQTKNTTNVASLAMAASNSNTQNDFNTAGSTIVDKPAAGNSHSAKTVSAHTNNTSHTSASHHSNNTVATGHKNSASGAAINSVNHTTDNVASADQNSSTAAIVASSGSVLAKPAAVEAGHEFDKNKEHPKAAPVSAPSRIAAPSSSAVPASARVNAHPLAANNAPGNINPAGNGPASVLSKDTIRQIEIAYRRVTSPADKSLIYTADTLAVTNLIVDKQKPVNPVPSQPQEAQHHKAVAAPSAPAPAKPTAIAKVMSQPTTAAPASPVPQAAAASSVEAIAASDNIKLVSLSQFKIASRFSRLWNAERFQLMVQSVKADLSRAQFYAGLTGGLNASLFTSSTLAGFQAGITGLLVFSDQWSIAGELKFYQRFNTGSSIKDNYVKQDEWVPGTYSVVNGVSYRQWNWRQDTVAHSYNFTTVQTIELPLMLRYNARRFFAEAGLNMMYAFAINAEEIDKPYGNATSVSRQMPATFTPESVSGNKPAINTGDFGSRFGLGYALGVGYQINPAFQANIRMMQSVWDNATSVGAQKVSRSLYQTPSIQISVGYRFKQGKAK